MKGCETCVRVSEMEAYTQQSLKRITRAESETKSGRVNDNNTFYTRPEPSQTLSHGYPRSCIKKGERKKVIQSQEETRKEKRVRCV